MLWVLLCDSQNGNWHSYGWLSKKTHKLWPSLKISCVPGGIVCARKVLVEELRSRVENGEETLWNPLAPSAFVSREWQLSRAKQFRQLRRLALRPSLPLQIFLLVAWFQVDSTTLAHKCSFRLCYSCVLNEVSIVLFSAEDWKSTSTSCQMPWFKRYCNFWHFYSGIYRPLLHLKKFQGLCLRAVFTWLS